MAPRVLPPSFSSDILQDRTDGYWIIPFQLSPKDRVPGLVVSGLNTGLVQFLDNPINKSSSKDCSCEKTTWDVYDISYFEEPVSVVAADVTGNGLLDLIVSHQYGPNMIECDMTGGWVSWLENPGRDACNQGRCKEWTKRDIGRWPAMHRLRAGYFTQRSILEIIAAPVVHGKKDKVTPVPILRFQAPEKPRDAIEWQRDVVDDEHLSVVHEIVPKKFDGPHGLESLLVASREGVSRLYFKSGTWHFELLNVGEPHEAHQTAGYEAPGAGDNWGCGTVDAGKVGNDPFAYIASVDPFHGGKVSVYAKVDRGLDTERWERYVLDVYGTPTQNQKWGDGPGHYVVCGDFDGDGDDEFLVSLIGALDRGEDHKDKPIQGGFNPNKGIMYYKAIDLEKGIFAKWRIANESSARIAVGDFNGNPGKGAPDVASISYNVKDYYQEPEPKVTIHTNNIASVLPLAASLEDSIRATLWDGEGLVYLAQPTKIKALASKSLIQVANYAISVEIHPPKGKVSINTGEGVKVIYGSLTENANGKSTTRKPLGGDYFPALASTTSEVSALDADANLGAIILRMAPAPGARELEWEDIKPDTQWKKAGDVPINVTLDLKVQDSGLEMPKYKFTRVDQLWWGKDDDRFKNKEFYNMPGFHFRFLDSKVHIAHIQFWTAGPEVSAGAHNHANDYFEEIHVSLSLGTHNGGMSMVKPEHEEEAKTPAEAEELSDEKWFHEAQKPLVEHGSIWHRERSGKAIRGVNNVVSYPWHKWQGGSGDHIDVWMAIEFNPDLDL